MKADTYLTSPARRRGMGAGREGRREGAREAGDRQGGRSGAARES